MKWFRKRRSTQLYDQIVMEVTPSIDTSKKLLEAFQAKDTPSAFLEIGIAKLFAVHRAVLAATKDEEERIAILPKIHENFFANFKIIASRMDQSERELIDLILRRLQCYDALIDARLPQWDQKLSQEIYENVTRQPPDTAIALVVGIPIIEEMNATTEFLRSVLR